MSLQLKLGPMWARKTTSLIGEYQKWRCIGKQTLVINHSADNRYDDGTASCLSSHDLVKIPCVAVARLEDVDPRSIEESQAIFINEGQFFANLKDIVLHWVEDLGKHVYIAGLDGDRNRQKFGELIDLIPYADHYEKLYAKCKLCLDGTDAIFTYDRTQTTGDQVQVGVNQYLPLCRKHYLGMCDGGHACPP